MKPLAVFDWNGTLFDDLEANLAGANAVVEMFGLPALTAEQYQDHFTFPILHFYVSLGIGTVEYLARHEEAAQRFLSVYEETALRCSLRDGAEDVLAWLNEHDVHCLLLSNHLRENVEQSLARFHIRHYFSNISCNEQYDAAFIQKMNKQERLAVYLEEHGFDPENAFIVGDSLEEPEIARHLGLTAISITGGCLSEERLKTGGQDCLVHSMHALKSHLAGTPALSGERLAG